ncbi:helix-turn-helix domain-containing protein [Peptostreptococcus sp. D1]|uniref:helix-turn-helix domain-containing protein n=1 Tax=Peptostreptococcus sp. D1 TaxID=72304 RepID=UPI0008DF3970|nr:helix-turn-helix transcriptional regulator [Peptostreptococcus sp. D1]SFE39072.1 Helix-turn-helix domain-containing protein [Peptostreptococcus sp. D1]
MGITLKAARVNAGLTQTVLAKKMNTTAKTISNWESGNTAIPMNKFNEFCNICQISQDNVKVPSVNDGVFEV